MALVDHEISRQHLMTVAQEEGIEKAIRCAFLSGGSFELEVMANRMLTNDFPGGECEGWGTKASAYITRLLAGDSPG